MVLERVRRLLKLQLGVKKDRMREMGRALDSVSAAWNVSRRNGGVKKDIRKETSHLLASFMSQKRQIWFAPIN